MKLGTPISPNSIKILILGGGELGKEIAIEAQRLGLEVAVADKYDWAPAMHVAHRRYVVDISDYNQLMRVIKTENPDYIVPEIEAINVQALKDAEKEGYKVIPNAKAVEITMNRISLREFASSLGVPTTRFAFAENEDEAKEACEKVGLPCLIKPEMSSSGKGHTLVKELNEAPEGFRRAIKEARGKSKRVIVEEFVDIKTELTVLTYRHVLESKIETLTLEPVEHQRPKGVYHYIESWHPSTVSEEIKKEARIIANKVVSALGGLGIFGVEILITSDKRVLFSEVSPRPHDTGMVTMASMELSEFAIHVRSILGIPVPRPKLLTPAASHVILADDYIEVPCLEGVEKLSIQGVQIRWFGKPRSYKERRMGVILATGDTVNDARIKAREIAKLLKVVPCG